MNGQAEMAVWYLRSISRRHCIRAQTDDQSIKLDQMIQSTQAAQGKVMSKHILLPLVHRRANGRRSPQLDRQGRDDSGEIRKSADK